MACIIISAIANDTQSTNQNAIVGYQPLIDAMNVALHDQDPLTYLMSLVHGV